MKFRIDKWALLSSRYEAFGLSATFDPVVRPLLETQFLYFSCT